MMSFEAKLGEKNDLALAQIQTKPLFVFLQSNEEQMYVFALKLLILLFYIGLMMFNQTEP